MWFTTYILPIIQSILASKISSTMDDWLKSSDDSDINRFNQIMKQCFIAAVKKVKGDMPVTVKDNVNELFDECRDLVLNEIRGMVPAKIPAYIEKDLYNAFKDELEKCDEAIPRINNVLLQEIQNHSSSNSKAIQNLSQNVISIKQTVENIQTIAQGLAENMGLPDCSIIPYTESQQICLPQLCSERPQLVAELANKLKEDHSIVLYAGVLEGKTVTSRLLAKSFQPDYNVVEIDFTFSNVQNLDYILQTYETGIKQLFVLDGIRFDSGHYETFCKRIKSQANLEHLFIINCYDKISDHILADDSLLTEEQLPPLTKDDIKGMIPSEKKEAFAGLVWGLFQGQPFLTNTLCLYLNKKSWNINEDELCDLFSFSSKEPLTKKVKNLLFRTVKDQDAYNLLNRLMTFDRPFTESQCADIASINPSLRNPARLLNQLEGTWVESTDGKYRISKLLRKTVKPDLLQPEAKDCYLYEVNQLLQTKKLTLADALSIMNSLIKAKDFEFAGVFYITLLVKLKEQNIPNNVYVSIIRSFWVGLQLPTTMSNRMKLAVRCSQLALIKDLRKDDEEKIIEDITELQNAGGFEKELQNLSTQTLAAHCLLSGDNDRAIPLQQKLLASYDEDLIGFKTEDAAIVSLNNVKDINALAKWLPLYVDLGYPQDWTFTEGAIIVVNRICDATPSNERIVVLQRVIKLTEGLKANIFFIAATARLIDCYSQSAKLDAAKNAFDHAEFLLGTSYGELLLNYSYGLALYNHDRKENAVPYLEKAAKVKNIGLACMVAFNARCTYALILGDTDEKSSTVVLFKELVDHSQFTTMYSAWEQDAILCTLAYALCENNQFKESVGLLLKVEHHLWTQRNVKDEHYIKLSIKFVILALYIQVTSEGGSVDSGYAVPDYGLFSKETKNIEQVYNPERNFSVEVLLYKLAEKYANEDAALEIVEHMLDYQREDAKHLGHYLSLMSLAFPLCLKHNRKDIVEYIMLTVLGAPNKNKEERTIDYEHLVLLAGLQFVVAHRALCLINGKEYDDEWLFSLLEKATALLDTPQETRFMVEQMHSNAPQYVAISDVTRKGSVYLYHFKDIAFREQFLFLWKYAEALDQLSEMSSAQGFVKAFVLDYAKFLIKENPDCFKIAVDDVDSYFAKIMHLSRLDLIKKVIQGLYFKVNKDVILSDDMLEFIND